MKTLSIFLTFLVHLVTDSKDRPEIKAVIGIISAVSAFFWLWIQKDVTGFLALAGFALSLFGVKTAEDAALDKPSTVEIKVPDQNRVR